ncbi:MAG: hypothetical protein ACHQPI_09955 [Thermoanaerobaculia bacterium]
MLPRTGLALLLLALPALAADAPPPSPTPAPTLLGSFRLFPDLWSPPPIRIEGGVHPSETLRIRQPGDPDSVISPGAQGLSHQIRLLPALEINDILLKAYAPDPTLEPNDNRLRAAGAFSPLDKNGRPYQLRLGARLVW